VVAAKELAMSHLAVFPKTLRIQQLNDALRTQFVGGHVLLTAGFQTLHDEQQAALLLAIRHFNDFTPDNDPYGEHDFVAVELDGVQVFCKIDYYDPTLQQHSVDAANPVLTHRVMTVMLAAEY
jgi:hypothetical protein